MKFVDKCYNLNIASSHRMEGHAQMAIRPRLTKGREGFGKRIAWLRSQKGWTLADLGKEVGVSGTCVWNWEEGNTHPRPASLASLAKALEVTPEHLLDGQAEQKSLPTNGNHEAVEAETLPPISLAELINRAREAIAEAAGLPASKVRIVLDYDG
jgi:transcriptional regulator with XRE-family HTH domain